jgi:DNA mismatch repair ATPase MutL
MASKKDPLGNNPLSKGIFSKTESVRSIVIEDVEENISQNPESRIQNPATSNQQPVTSNQQPATRIQNPTTSSQQPVASNQNLNLEYTNQQPATSNQNPEPIKHKPAASNQNPESRIHKTQTRIHKTEYSLLLDDEKDKITLQVSTDINDWLDNLVRSSKRKHGKKIEKQVWTQAALQLLRFLPLDLTAIDTPECLESELKNLVYRLQNMETINHKP